MYIYIYIYIYGCSELAVVGVRRNAVVFLSVERNRARCVTQSRTPNLPTNIVDFRGFDSSTILI